MVFSVDHLKQVEAPLGYFYLGRALVNRHQYDEALKAFDKAEKAGYAAPQVQLQRAGIYRAKGDVAQAKQALVKLEEQSGFSSEFHFQMAGVHLAEGEKVKAIKSLERSTELDPGHTGACSSSAISTTWPATTMKRSATTSAA